MLQGSIMAALLVEPSLIRIDPITLAALQDTGWYSVNLSRAQSLVWGEGKTSTVESILLFDMRLDKHYALVETRVKTWTCEFTVCFCVLGEGHQFGSVSTCHNSAFFCTDR